MTKKHFEAAAKIVKEWGNHPGNDWASEAIQEAFIELFREFNPKFDVERFRAACQPPVE